MPLTILEPLDARMTAAMLARAGADRLVVTPRGAGTKVAWGGLLSIAGAYLSTRNLTSPIEHYAGDLVATIPAGATLADANAMLGRAQQWLPIDPPHADRATIGGIVATNDSGPRRHRYGSPRDLIIGIEVALADGRVAKAGGRVVKNVAGYDLSRLLCGSFGSLAVITSATFKLAPLAAVSRTVLARVADAPSAAAMAREMASLALTPSAIEIEAPTARILVRFETTARAADQMAAAACSRLEAHGAETDILLGDAERELWQRHEELIWDRPGIVLKLSVLPTDTTGVFEVLEASGSTDSSPARTGAEDDLGSAGGYTVQPTRGVEWSLTGRGALGVLLVRVNAEVEDQIDVVKRLGVYAASRGGSLAVLEAPAEVRSRLEPVTHSPEALAISRAVKARFDAHGVLPPVPGTLC